ncbi:MAG: hypothetical protein KF761_01975 [Salinibacterium sp.]|nr:hypothetical protein [Salinibacterium sp.]
MRGLRHYAFIGTAALILGTALGGTLVVLLVPEAPPPSLVSEQRLETVTPAVIDFTDPREVRVALTVDSASGLRSPVGGVLTALSCVPGGQVSSGSNVFAVDGASVVALATAVPLWRDIPVGDDGQDVIALENELLRLGAEVEPDGVWRWADALAFDALLRPVGVITTDDGTVPIVSLVWLPSPATVLATCSLSIGSILAPGDVVARFAPRIRLATFAPPPDAVGGARELTLARGSVSAGADGVIAGPEALEVLAAAPEFAELDLEQGHPTLTASWVLVEPIRVAVVPPSAIRGLSGNRGCVQERGGATPVTVIASQLGRTLVVPPHRLGPIAVHPMGGTGCP